MIYGLSRLFFARRARVAKDALSLNLSLKMMSTIGSFPMHDYKETVKTLNSLQTNAALLASYKKENNRTIAAQKSKLTDTTKYLSRTGVTLEQLDCLSVIHVTGTKGKGSTCAFCESILRQYGFKTGFYSSPHLIAVRERIRINGKPLSEEQFSKYFWLVFNALNKTKEHEHDFPPYFKFLTIMAFNAFLIEKVDVAIIEVGIGGEYDCTNILRKVPVVGITSLGFDHTSLLGHTIEEIAWQKGGILKIGASAFTVEQPSGAWDILLKRAAERNCSLQRVPLIEAYDWGDVKVATKDEVQNINASLALQLAYAWLTRRENGKSGYTIPSFNNNYPQEAFPFKVTPSMLNGLRSCSWSGRMQTLHRGPVSFYLDGAHTSESIHICTQWFLSQLDKTRVGKRVLVFNAIGDRDINKLLSILMKCQFDIAIFCPNTVHKEVSATSGSYLLYRADKVGGMMKAHPETSSPWKAPFFTPSTWLGTLPPKDTDQANFKVTYPRQQESSQKILNIWNDLNGECQKQNDIKDTHEPFDGNSRNVKRSLFLPSLTDVVSYINNEVMTSCPKANVLVTGSLHLVGCMLHILDPELSNASPQFFTENSMMRSSLH